MKRIFTLVILLVLVHSVNAQFSSNKYVEDELIIWLQPDVKPDEFAKNFSQDVKPKRELSNRLNIWLFEFSTGATQRSARMGNLRQSNKVKYVQNNHFVTSRAITPDDEHYDWQWAPAKIKLPDVWDKYTTGGTSADGDDIVIAIIDGGFDLAHEDLNFWKNTNEIPGNGIDDDNNGYIDDYDGWNAYNSKGNIPNDNHGTHVAGIAGAIGNNDTGISGVNWDVGILPVAGSSRTEATVVEAYSYILEMRALYNETNGQSGAFIVVTNSSFGVDQGNPDDFPIWCSMYDELGNEGILNCAATANKNWNIDQVGDVPTACSSQFLIAVTNTTSSDNKYPEAGYGITHIDIGAPGTNIYSTLPRDNYGNLTGTSMAAPHVAGVIALMYASMCQDMIEDYKNAPGDFALMVRQYLLEGADNISSLNGLVAHGRLNALEAIENIFGANSTISGPTIVCSSNATFTLSNLPNGYTVTWTKSSNLAYVSGQGTSYTVKALSPTTSGLGWVQATVSGLCGDVELPPYSVYVGTPPGNIGEPLISGESSYSFCIPPNKMATVSVISHPEVTNRRWALYNEGEVFFTLLGNEQTTMPFSISGNYPQRYLKLTEQIPGCSSVTSQKNLVCCEDFDMLSVGPNPASEVITITELENDKSSEPWALRLVSRQGTVAVNVTTTLPKTINVSGIQQGVYILHAQKGNHVEQHRVVVE